MHNETRKNNTKQVELLIVNNVLNAYIDAKTVSKAN